jgi:hypothetical protein
MRRVGVHARIAALGLTREYRLRHWLETAAEAERPRVVYMDKHAHAHHQ